MVEEWGIYINVEHIMCQKSALKVDVVCSVSIYSLHI